MGTDFLPTKFLQFGQFLYEHFTKLMLNLILKGNTGVSHSNTHQNTVGGREGGREGGMDGWMGGWLGGWEGMKHFFIGFQFTRCPWWLAWFYSLHTNNPLALTWLLSIYMHYLWTTYIPMNDWSDMYAFGRIGLPKCNRMSTELDSSIHNWMVSSPLL